MFIILILVFLLYFRYFLPHKLSCLLLNITTVVIFVVAFNKLDYRVDLALYFLAIAIFAEASPPSFAYTQSFLLFIYLNYNLAPMGINEELILSITSISFAYLAINHKKDRDERREAQYNLYKRSRELSVSRRVSFMIQKTLDYKQLIEISLKALGKNGLGFDRSIVFLYEFEKDSFYPFKSSGYLTEEETYWVEQNMLKDNQFCSIEGCNEEMWDRIKDIFIENNINNAFGRCFNTQRVILVRSNNYDLSADLLRERIGTSEFALLPLLEKGSVIGIVYVDNNANKEELDYENLDNAMSILNQVAMALTNARLYEVSQEDALTDALTGLHNKRYLDMKFNSYKEIAKEKGMSLSLIILDIDYFKSYNDNNGHIKGNIALKRVADLLQKEARSRDVVVRFGGEEFCILLLDADMDGAMILAKRIRKRIEAEEFENQIAQPNKNLTISLGVTTYKDGEALDVFIERADMALYKSKLGGRNKVEGSEVDG